MSNLIGPDFQTWLERVDPTMAAAILSGNSALMPVDMEPQDVGLDNYRQGFRNMLKVVSGLLSSHHTVTPVDQEVKEEQVPWSKLYQLNAAKSTPKHGVIELQYKPVWGKGVLGNLAWSAGYLAQNPIKTLSQHMGLSAHPETSYLNQFKSDLFSYASQGRISGLDDWDITTSGPGRNILLYPKKTDKGEE